MIPKWFMKPIIGNNGDIRENGLDNEAIVSSVLKIYVEHLSAKE